MGLSTSNVVLRLRNSFKHPNDVRTALKKTGTNNEGLLNKKEMIAFPGKKYKAEKVDAIFVLVDMNSDGPIDMGKLCSKCHTSG